MSWRAVDPRTSPRKVIGIDIDIRENNRKAIESHPLSFKIKMIEGSTIDSDIVENVKSNISSDDKVLVSLDSNHTEEHVYAELDAYSDLVTVGSYCIVFDTIVEDLPIGSFPNRPWDVGNNPKIAAIKWLNKNPNFIVDREIDNKLLVTVAPEGYLRRLA